jgi:deoxyribose-phosphate aldolase
MELNRYLEHTALAPTITIADVDRLVSEARQHNIFGVCVPPFWVKRASREIGQDPITLVTVAGFPLGYNLTETKIDEIKRAIENGANEVDVVWNLSSFRTRIPWTKIDIAKCAKAAHDREALLKVIVETAYLSEDELREACQLCADAGADFVKTSTGFAPTGASVEKVRLMRSVLPKTIGIKASGGIKTREQALQLINAGADRIGTSSAVAMLSP